MQASTNRAFILADNAGVDIWRRKSGYHWAKRALLMCVVNEHDAHHAPVHGPFNTASEAALNACNVLGLRCSK